MADFYHRTEVRDITGHCNSLLFNPDDFPDARRLKRGSTCFVRYASKAYFSDLMTQVRRRQLPPPLGARAPTTTTCQALR
jgi:hypothetical protein